LNRKTNLATAEIVDPFGDRVGEIGVGLDIVEKLGVTLAIDGPCLIRHIGSGLTLFPPPPVDDEELVVTLGADGPEPDDREEALGLGADGLVREIERGTAILRLRGSCLRHLSARERSAGGHVFERSRNGGWCQPKPSHAIAPASPIVPRLLPS